MSFAWPQADTPQPLSTSLYNLVPSPLVFICIEYLTHHLPDSIQLVQCWCCWVTVVDKGWCMPPDHDKMCSISAWVCIGCSQGYMVHCLSGLDEVCHLIM